VKVPGPNLSNYVTRPELLDSIKTDYVKPPGYWDHDTLKLYTVPDTTFSGRSDTSVATSNQIYSFVINHIGGSTKVDYVADITALENYTGNAKTVVVQDTLRGGTFNYVSTGVPDSGTIFNAYGGGFWHREFGGTEVNVRWFGAKGDGITDATNAIQLAIYSVDVNHGHAGGSVYFPSGIYIISSPITLGGYVNMHGDYWNSFLKIANGANCNMFVNPTNAPINYLKIYDLEFYGNRSNQTAGSAFSITYNGYNNSDIYFTHILISNFKDNGIYIENGWQYHIENSVIETFGKYCVKLNPTQQSDPSAASADLRRVFIQNSSLLAADSGSIYANGSASRWILGLNVNNCHIGKYNQYASSIHIRGVKDFVISSNRILGAPFAGDTTFDIIRIDSNARVGVINANTITNLAEYYNTVDSYTRYGISVWDTCNNITISKNQFFKDSIKQNIYIAPKAYLITTDSTVNDSLMANIAYVNKANNFSQVNTFNNLSVNPTTSGYMLLGKSFSFNGYSTVGGGVGSGIYYDGTNWRYRITGTAVCLFWGGSGGEASVYTAPSGTTGNIAAITEKFRVANDGSVWIITNTDFAGNFLTRNSSTGKIGERTYSEVRTDLGFASGTATLASGTVTVSSAFVKTGAVIFLTYNTPSGTQGFLSAPSGSIVNGTSFVINSSSASDNSTVNWKIINP
jgi:hypothetical protein